MMQISPHELHARIKAGTAPTIIDVRTRAEYEKGHVQGAIHLPFLTIGSHIAELPGPPDGPVVVYCLRGPRAWLAGGVLRRRSLRQVVYLEGHMHAWRKARLPEERVKQSR